MTAKFYGFERSFLHDTTEEDSWVIDMVRASEYVKLESEVAALQEQLSNYSMSAGQADQRKSESDTVRVALGFSADAYDVAPCDLVDAIAALQEQVRELAAENVLVREQSEEVYAAGYNHGHLNTVDGIAYAPGTKDDFYPNALQVMPEVETPATDAAIREIRAQAVESYANYSDECYGTHDKSGEDARVYAARIRAGEQP